MSDVEVGGVVVDLLETDTEAEGIAEGGQAGYRRRLAERKYDPVEIPTATA